MPTPLPFAVRDRNIGAFLLRAISPQFLTPTTQGRHWESNLPWLQWTEGWIKDLPKHVGHNEEANMTASYVHLIQVTYAPIARCDGNVLELNVHVVFGCLDMDGLVWLI